MLVGDIVRRNARYFADCDAVVVPGGVTRSWAELDIRTNRFANALLGLGLTRGDRVAIFAPNCVEYFEFFFGCAKSGVVGAPTNVRLAPYEITAYYSYVTPRAILVHADLAEEARRWLSDVPGAEWVVGFGGDHGFDLDLERLIGAAAPEDPAVALDEDDTYMLGPTSGTTGIPKATILTHRNAISAMLNWLAEMPMPERGTALQNIPYFFNPGGPAGIHPVLLKGGRTVVYGGFTPRAFLEAVQEYGVTNTVAVPTMVQMIVAEPDCESFDLSSLKGVFSGGSPWNAPLFRRAREVLGDVIYPLYGMAESYSCGLTLRPESIVLDGTPEQQKQVTSAGKPHVLMQLRVAGVDGEEVPHDGETAGEIWMAGPTISPGYYEMPDETAVSREGEWFRTGDLAVVDTDGFVTIVDRLKDMIITGGINVFSIEVERALLQHPEVDQVAVIGLPHQTWGEAIHAVVCRVEGSTLTEAALVEFAGERLAGFKKPRSIEFVDALPVSATGKILKKVVRAERLGADAGSPLPAS